MKSTIRKLSSPENSSVVEVAGNQDQKRQSPGGGPVQVSSVFKAAYYLGLFPVSGIGGNVEFKPLSLKLIATVAFILAVLVLEGLGLIHMMISGKRSGNANVDNLHRQEWMSADLAPVLHYGSTVSNDHSDDIQTLFVNSFDRPPVS